MLSCALEEIFTKLAEIYVNRFGNILFRFFFAANIKIKMFCRPYICIYQHYQLNTPTSRYAQIAQFVFTLKPTFFQLTTNEKITNKLFGSILAPN